MSSKGIDPSLPSMGMTAILFIQPGTSPNSTNKYIEYLMKLVGNAL